VCLSQLSAVDDGDLLRGAARRAAQGLDLLHHLHALGDAPEDHVLAVQPGGQRGGEEELQPREVHYRYKQVGELYTRQSTECLVHGLLKYRSRVQTRSESSAGNGAAQKLYLRAVGVGSRVGH
jgi:hypothetical protein